MKKLLLTILITVSYFTSEAQIQEKKPFFIGNLGTTFGINQQFRLSEEGNGPFITPKSILLRAEVGYQFDKRWSSSVSMGYDHHFRYDINSIPYFGTVRYNFIAKSSSAYFIDASLGRMWRPSESFSNGNYYKVGIGLMNFSSNRWNGLIRLDFHRKKIAEFENGNLDSISLGIGFSFF
ncbi:hypothetical protein [uncultured Tenacibaculum sp.]|uniref:hypothetical protein n=1 Tax=uncultured Tenacibaculum sp. TaxID=174713 RepID=UPI00263647A3|nr:hypothetical protein [uncultured Tenacibaculum sp.]